ncbi:hypothetical protein [uncultured Microbacterium sp.]|uniref:hypothetical protein n=1 Tax=uncultured Microbacterium sp. TaxID=191216 RepID=UPI0026070018|nr:hypothetical protein [uncultured Microbacterium sp.]
MTIVPDGMILDGVAWLQFGDADVQLPVQIKRWTDNAVGVECSVGGEVLRCWIWRGACEPREFEDGRT